MSPPTRRAALPFRSALSRRCVVRGRPAPFMPRRWPYPAGTANGAGRDVIPVGAVEK
ncbi:hypothetical protein ACFV29_31570 [Streptomyces sp. NPDC059690]|uniref:hypothetical protein n=1 Tax=Streptomyces sp. NPDC059690 TaxID=3346907 RepID=UPI0036BCE9DE